MTKISVKFKESSYMRLAGYTKAEAIQIDYTPSLLSIEIDYILALHFWNYSATELIPIETPVFI
jgi:hypothetical protein